MNNIKTKFKKNIDYILKIIVSKILSLFENIYIFTLAFFRFKFNSDKTLYLNIYENLKLNYNDHLPINIKINFTIDKNFILDLALFTQITLKNSAINIDHGKILYALLRSYLSENLEKKNITIVEIGTAKGFSSICMAKALNDHNVNGKIFTFDILDHTSKRIWNSYADTSNGISRLDLLNKWQSLINDYIIFISGFSHINLKKIFFNRINFAFIDGSHYGHDVEFEFNEITKYQFKNDVIIFDDYNVVKYPDLSKKIDWLLNNKNYKRQIINGSNGRNYILAIKDD